MDLCPAACVEFTRPEDVSFYGSLFEGKPVDAFEEGEAKPWMMEKPYLPVQERCTGCQVCVRECPTNAITIEVDNSKPPTMRPKPVIAKAETGRSGDNYWRPLSEYTREFLKRPVRSPFSRMTDWRPMIKERGVSQTWRTMEEEKKQ
jgi:ferredoxin